jgi:peptidoglycan/xylan/chitin deacetylase (PgdA/CDA1 family)
MLVLQNINKDLITPRVIITFDDGNDDVYNKAYPIMAANKQKGVNFIITSKIDVANYMTSEQLITLYNAGWDISNHTQNHEHLDLISEELMHSEIDNAYNDLFNFSKSRDIIAYPYGDYNENVLNYVRIKNYKFGISTINAIHDNQINLLVEQYLINRKGVYNDTAIETVKSYIDSVILTGGLLVLMFHKIVDADAETYEYLTTDFQTVSDYIKTKVDAGLLKCVTMSEYYEDYLYGENTAAQKEIRGLSHG